MNCAQKNAASSNRRGPFVILIALVTAILLLGGVILGLVKLRQPEIFSRDEPILIPAPPPVDPHAIDNLLPRDAIPAIDDPLYATAAEAISFMDPDEQVIGLVINGDARAYPLPILASHEIVNDIIGDEPVAVTWCPLCYTALVFSRQVNERVEPLSFGVSGKLLRNTLVMYDRQSESLWSQLYGAAVDGPLQGARLSFFPSVLTEWQAWREEQPETLVLSKPLTCVQFKCGTYAENPRGSYDVDPYAGYYESAEEGVLNRQLPRDEGHNSGRPKERVLGLRLGGVQRAYPEAILKNQPLINDVIKGQPVLVWFDPGTSTGAAFGRQVDGRTLSFDQAPDESNTLIDEQTGTLWSAVTGQAISGPLRGQRLPSLVVTPAFAFGWYGYFPDSETYGDR